MKPRPQFLAQPKRFWANVRTISAKVGYTRRGTGQISVPTVREMADAMRSLNLTSRHIADPSNKLTPFGITLVAYFKYRARVLNDFVEPRLMDATAARRLFQRHKQRLRPSCHIPMNKQKGKKRAPAYFTGIINMLIAASAGGFSCDFNPRALTTVTRHRAPLRTLARWIDGAFPSTVNPVAVWEIKEYYYTTTFGSRVADGVYETLLDGMELEELNEHEKINIKHYLMVDSHRTWWKDGKSYLCRIIDMLHMGYVDEVLFGREVAERLPGIVRQWVRIERDRRRSST